MARPRGRFYNFSRRFRGSLATDRVSAWIEPVACELRVHLSANSTLPTDPSPDLNVWVITAVLLQRGYCRAHLLQNRRRQRDVALCLRDFLPGRVHPA